MSGLGKGMSGVVGISRNGSGAGTFPDKLLIHVVMTYECAIAFTDLERGSFSHKYYPDYVIRMVPHSPWQKKLIKLPLAC